MLHVCEKGLVCIMSDSELKNAYSVLNHVLVSGTD